MNPAANIRSRRQARLSAKGRELAERREQRNIAETKAQSAKKRMKEAGDFGFGFFGGNDPGVDPEDPHGTIFRRMGGRHLRTPSSVFLDESSRQGYEMWAKNPFIRRIANCVGHFIVGNGIRPNSDIPALQQFLDEMWDDEVNDFEGNQLKYAREFRLEGEILWERVANHFQRPVRINPIDKLWIAGVKGHHEFNLIPSQVFIQTRSQPFPVHIINTLPIELQKTLGDDVPMAYYYRANEATGSLRGLSDFLPIFEWADLLDQSTFTMMERMIILLTYVWHLEMVKYNEDEAAVLQEQLQNAGPNSALITREGTKLTAVTPDIKSADFKGAFDTGREVLAAGGGFPTNWLAAPGQANVGEAASMDMPTLKSLTWSQKEFIKGPLMKTFRDAVNLAFAQGRFNGVMDLEGKPITSTDQLVFSFDTTPVSKKELGQVATALGQLVNALQIAFDDQLITKPEYGRVIRTVINEISDIELEMPKILEDMHKLGINVPDLSIVRKFDDRLNGKTQPPTVPASGPGSKIDALSNQSA